MPLCRFPIFSTFAMPESKRVQQRRKRRFKAKEKMLETTQYIVLYQPDQQEEELWKIVKDGFRGILFSDDLKRFETMLNWRFVELSLISVLCARKWLILDEIDEINQDLYALIFLNVFKLRVSYESGRVKNACRSKKTHLEQHPKKRASTPPSTLSEFHAELAFLNDPDEEYSTVTTTRVLYQWYESLTAILSGLMHVSKAYTLKVAIAFSDDNTERLVESNPKSLSEFDQVKTLSFLSFFFTENFVRDLDDWNLIQQSHDSAVHFNTTQVVQWMTDQWDDLLRKGDYVIYDPLLH